MALPRTEGAAMAALGIPAVNFSLVPTHRPGSTQNTSRSMGSLSGGTMRSFAITRSCLPPVTISPANNNRARFELLISTSRLT